MQAEHIREVRVSYGGPRRRKPPIISPHGTAQWVRELIGEGAARESFVAIYLDGRHVPIGYSVVSTGTATASLVHPREVFQPALAAGAVALVVAHNHPSGAASPSTEDKRLTERLAAAGKLLGVRLLDHLVIGDAQWFSFREHSPEQLESGN